jgi:hypothetical protein
MPFALRAVHARGALKIPEIALIFFQMFSLHKLLGRYLISPHARLDYFAEAETTTAD